LIDLYRVQKVPMFWATLYSGNKNGKANLHYTYDL